MEDPLLNPKNEETSGLGLGEKAVEYFTIAEKKTGQGGFSTIAGGAVNCFLAVDNVIRATGNFGTPRKISLSAPVLRDTVSDSTTTPTSTSNDEAEELNSNLLPLQNTRHLFIREYKKHMQWPTQGTKKYQILNTGRECIYYAGESCNFLRKVPFLKRLLPLRILVVSLAGEKVLEMELKGLPLPFFNKNLTIKNSVGQLIGKIYKIHSCSTQLYSIKSWDDREILRIIGPDGSNCCVIWACGEQDFDIALPGELQTSIGKISLEWEYSLEDLIGLFVPLQLDELTMATLLGALFLIDFNFYERKRDFSCMGRWVLSLVSFGLFIGLLFLIAKK